jgi:hypothetical protein
MSKFKRTIAGLAVAAAALTAGLGAGVATPETADAATGCYWRIPDHLSITHSNGWWAYSAYYRQAGTYKYPMRGIGPGGAVLYGTLTLTRFDTSGSRPQVEFTLTWSNGSAGVYTGTIDSNGFVSGTTYDRWHPWSTAQWHFDDVVDCV